MTIKEAMRNARRKLANDSKRGPVSLKAERATIGRCYLCGSISFGGICYNYGCEYTSKRKGNC